MSGFYFDQMASKARRIFWAIIILAIIILALAIMAILIGGSLAIIQQYGVR